jgi:alpha-methylacyl-CoA racemase
MTVILPQRKTPEKSDGPSDILLGVLQGVSVLDLSTVGPASRCTAALRDLGARVTKVLAPEGKQIEPPFFAYGAGRGMASVRLDLKSEEGLAEFLRMCGEADVVVESYRPGVAARLGIGYDAVRDVNPLIVYASLSGYGQDGPYAQWAGHDINYLGVGGFLGAQGRRADGGPAMPGATIADGAGGGLHAALSICAALFHRERTGRGAYLDVSTTEGVLHLMALFVDEFLATGHETSPGSALLTGKYGCYDVYQCADGKWLSVGAIEPQFFANLCEALGHGELAEHQMDDEKQEEIRAAFAAVLKTKPRDEWVAELAAKNTCVAPVLSIGEVTRDEHLRARGAFTEAQHPDHGTFEQVGPVLAGAQR